MINAEAVRRSDAEQIVENLLSEQVLDAAIEVRVRHRSCLEKLSLKKKGLLLQQDKSITLNKERVRQCSKETKLGIKAARTDLPDSRTSR